MKNKECTKCKTTLELSTFNKLSRSSDGLNTVCKVCVKIYADLFKEKSNFNDNYHSEYYIKNKEKILKRSSKWKKDNKEIKKISDKKWKEANIEKVKLKNKLFYNNNKDSILEKAREYREENKEHRKIINKNWFKNNKDTVKETRSSLKNKLAHSIRCRISNALSQKHLNKEYSVTKSLGCSFTQLITHLESKFQEGMTWENRGMFGWHIDHIVPLSSFDLTNENDFKKACHYSNLQPLWAKDNLSKGNKIVLT